MAYDLMRNISIHAPREGSDGMGTSVLIWPDKFLSTLPARGATKSEDVQKLNAEFLSTLPARGATQLFRSFLAWFTHFYPRSPRGERLTLSDWASRR